MSSNREIAEYYLELCTVLDDLSIRAMFGGHGFYSGNAMFGLEAYGDFYLKSDRENVDEFRELGGEPFVYEATNGKKSVMSYYRFDAEILEDREKLEPLLQSAFQAAMRSLRARQMKKKGAPGKKSDAGKTAGKKRSGKKTPAKKRG